VPGATRVARVRAATDVRCLTIPRSDFLALVESEPSLALAMLRELARRLSNV
jgi:CRP-like cAMP-binding protein